MQITLCRWFTSNRIPSNAAGQDFSMDYEHIGAPPITTAQLPAREDIEPQPFDEGQLYHFRVNGVCYANQFVGEFTTEQLLLYSDDDRAVVEAQFRQWCKEHRDELPQ
ncbi:MAG: hypothetical protein HY259_07650 [Chloroflexi bacterium]|nr:hypothetical protein [Chloroflexota bacterium]